jgi:hypothetical protein
MAIGIVVNPEPSVREAIQLEKFWADHYEELLARYPEQFVAVRDGDVMASNPDLAMLIYDLRDKNLSPRTDVAIQFISSRSGSLLL